MNAPPTHAFYSWKRFRWGLLAAWICCAIGTLIALPYDSQASQWMRQVDLPGDIDKALNLSETFAQGFGATAILITLLVVDRTKRAALWTVALMTVVAGTSSNLAKNSVVRIRPHSVGLVEVVTDAMLDESEEPTVERVEESYWDARQRSFPSGHAATAWSLMIGLSLVYPRGVLLFALFATLASIQRVSSGAHYPSDVCGGAAVAIMACGLLLAIPALRRQFTWGEQSEAARPLAADSST